MGESHLPVERPEKERRGGGGRRAGGGSGGEQTEGVGELGTRATHIIHSKRVFLCVNVYVCMYSSSGVRGTCHLPV